VRSAQDVASLGRGRDHDDAAARTLGTGESHHTESICEKCGAVLQVGDYPFCPHGRSALVAIPDDVPGGFTVENGFAEPRTFYSKSAHQRALAAENCEQRAYWHPGDKHLTRWDSVDLDAARALVTPRPKGDAVITVTEGESFRAGDLDG